MFSPRRFLSLAIYYGNIFWRTCIESEQVIIGFMLSAYFTLTMVTLHYLIDHRQQRNSIDRAFLAIVVPRMLAIQTDEVSERWTRAFDAAVLFLGDTQVVTSVAILVSGYIQLRCGLSIYHWEIIVDLAWFSSLTHLTALTSLRYYFRRRPAMAIWRVTFMGLTLLLLASALQPTGYVPSDTLSGLVYTDTPERLRKYLSTPALCLFNDHRRLELLQSLSRADDGLGGSGKNRPAYNMGIIMMSLAYLVIGYVTRVVRISQSVAETAEIWLRTTPINYLCAAYSTARRAPCRIKYLTRLWKGTLLVCIIIAEAVCEIANSMLWEIFWLAAALLWGTFKVIQHRQYSSLADENTWGFGQVLALLLSALPFWSLFSNLQESIHAPLFIDTHITAIRDVEGVGPLNRRAWFNGLVSYLFGTALTFAGVTVFAFSGRPFRFSANDGSDILFRYSGQIAIVYIVATSSSILVVIIFTTLALAVHFRYIGCHKLSVWYTHRTRNWSTLVRRRARTWIWFMFILLLLGSQLSVYLAVFVLTELPGKYLCSEDEGSLDKGIWTFFSIC